MSDVTNEASAWDDRRLCPDGGCLGVLDASGRCPVCGRMGPPAREGAAPSEDAAAGGDERTLPERAPDPGEPDGGDGWDARQLCSDGGCIGVVERGRCNVCGRAPA